MSHRTDILCKLTLAQAKQIFKEFDDYAKKYKGKYKYSVLYTRAIRRISKMSGLSFYEVYVLFDGWNGIADRVKSL